MSVPHVQQVIKVQRVRQFVSPIALLDVYFLIIALNALLDTVGSIVLL